MYDWSGFYIGANGGWGSSRKCWDIINTGAGAFVVAEGCHDATGGIAGGQIGYRWQAGTWVFGLEGQGNWADFKGSNISLIVRDAPQPVARSMPSACSPARSVMPPTTFCSTSRAARPLPTDRLPQSSTFPRASSFATRRRRHPLGRRGRRRPRIRLHPELVGRRSNTTICSCSDRTHDFVDTIAGRRALRHRPHQPGRRSRHRPRQLSLGWPGDREVLIFAFSTIELPKRPASRRPFCLVVPRQSRTRLGCRCIHFAADVAFRRQHFAMISRYMRTATSN